MSQVNISPRDEAYPEAQGKETWICRQGKRRSPTLPLQLTWDATWISLSFHLLSKMQALVSYSRLLQNFQLPRVLWWEFRVLEDGREGHGDP